MSHQTCVSLPKCEEQPPDIGAKTTAYTVCTVLWPFLYFAVLDSDQDTTVWAQTMSISASISKQRSLVDDSVSRGAICAEKGIPGVTRNSVRIKLRASWTKSPRRQLAENDSFMLDNYEPMSWSTIHFVVAVTVIRIVHVRWSICLDCLVLLPICFPIRFILLLYHNRSQTQL